MRIWTLRKGYSSHPGLRVGAASGLRFGRQATDHNRLG